MVKGNVYRKNVAAIIINKDKKVLMCEHIWIDNAWQFPQGGIEKKEDPKDSILREIEEEIGLKNIKIIDKMPENLIYTFPFYLREKFDFDGQDQIFFLIYFYGNDSEIRFDNQEKPEFKSFKWVEYNQPPKEVVYFKKISYFKALEYFKEQVEKLDLKKLDLKK